MFLQNIFVKNKVKKSLLLFVDKLWTKHVALDQCFSTGGPQPSSGPRSSFGWPPDFFFLLKMKILDTNIKKWLKINFISYKSIKKNKLIFSI